MYVKRGGEIGSSPAWLLTIEILPPVIASTKCWEQSGFTGGKFALFPEGFADDLEVKQNAQEPAEANISERMGVWRLHRAFIHFVRGRGEEGGCPKYGGYLRQ